jgi:superfamily II DNA or RNA helicase
MSSVKKGLRVLFIAHRKELIEQAYERLSQHGIRCGVVMGKHRLTNYGASVQVASIQTLARRESAEPFDVIFIDEAHRAMASQYRKVVDQHQNATVIGLTATPIRLDGSALGDLFTSMVVGISPEELIDRGYLTKPALYISEKVDKDTFSDVHIQRGDYNEKELAQRINTTQLNGDIVKNWKKQAGQFGHHPLTVGFAVNVEHSESLSRAFSAAGIVSTHIDGKTPKKQREFMLSQFRKGNIKVVWNVGILTEGFDLPSLECVILARPTKSVSMYYQMVGRVMRIAHGKSRAAIMDHAGCFWEHGLPWKTPEWELTTSKKKKKITQRPAVKVCPDCGAVNESVTGECLSCAYSFNQGGRKVVEIPGDLIEATDTPAAECKKCASRNFATYKLSKYTNMVTCKTCGYRQVSLNSQARPEKAEMSDKRREYERLLRVASAKVSTKILSENGREA